MSSKGFKHSSTSAADTFFVVPFDWAYAFLPSFRLDEIVCEAILAILARIKGAVINPRFACILVQFAALTFVWLSGKTMPTTN